MLYMIIIILYLAELDKTKMEQIFLLFLDSLLSLAILRCWEGRVVCLLSILVYSFSQSVWVYSPELSLAGWRQARAHLRQHWRQLRLLGLAWPQYSGRRREEEGGDPGYYVPSGSTIRNTGLILLFELYCLSLIIKKISDLLELWF